MKSTPLIFREIPQHSIYLSFRGADELPRVLATKPHLIDFNE